MLPPGPTPTPTPIPYVFTDTLVWSDEFTDAPINTAQNWKYEYEGNGSWSHTWNNEWQRYVNDGTGGGTNDKTTHATLHWSNSSGQHASSGASYVNEAKLCDDYHEYKVAWTPNSITMYFDDIQYFTKNITSSEFSEFRQPAYILLNLAVGGNWPGYPTGSESYPQYMYVDRVRVYQ
ncbi:MAG: glycoside hydrolase family 16 protein [Spirochaetales bacterium]|nr:glycoside hydrolase family 16 protein [Spirochaetales bacterium]